MKMQLFQAYIEIAFQIGYYGIVLVFYHQFYRLMHWWYLSGKLQRLGRRNWLVIAEIIDAKKQNRKPIGPPRTFRMSEHYKHGPFWKL